MHLFFEFNFFGFLGGKLKTSLLLHVGRALHFENNKPLTNEIGPSAVAHKEKLQKQ